MPVCHIFFSADKDGFAPLQTLGEINGFRFSRSGRGIVIADGVSSILVCDSAPRLEVQLGERTDTMQAAALLMHGYQYSMLAAGGLLLHGAAVVLRADGVAFCGVPGAGKSTQARLWQQHLGAAALNNDQPGLVFHGDRLYITGSPFSGKEPCYKNKAVPLRAFVFVEQAPENTAVPLSRAEAYSRLYLNNYLFPTSPETEALYKERIGQLAEAVPSVLLRCTISEQAVEAAFGAVFQNLKYHEVRPMKYRASSRFELKRVADDWLLIPRGTFSIDYGAAIVFNETGVLLWRELKEFCTKQALCDVLKERYAIDDATASADVSAFLAKMKENRLLEED